MKKLMKKFLKDESGLETVEYAIIAGLVSAALVTILAAMIPLINARFQRLQDALTDPV